MNPGKAGAALAVMALIRATAAQAAPDIPAPDVSAPDISGQVAVVSDYVYRGLSYSDGHAAVQGSITWTNAAGVQGLHLDGWVSFIDFGPGDPAKAELWGTVGYGGGLGPLTYDAGLEYATYPGAPRVLHYSYYDAFASLGGSVGPVSATVAARYSPDYSGGTGSAAFFDLTAEVPVAGPFSLNMGAGYADLKPAAGGTYMYWSAGLGAAWKGFTAAVRYHGSDHTFCATPCGDRVVFSLGHMF